MKITVYEKPTCTKCREMDRLLRENGVDFEKVNYYLEPLSKAKIKELLGKMVEHPDLIQRPIVERGGRAVLGRPVEKVKELL